MFVLYLKDHWAYLGVGRRARTVPLAQARVFSRKCDAVNSGRWGDFAYRHGRRPDFEVRKVRLMLDDEETSE